MTRYLVSDTNPQGMKLEDILRVIRRDILVRCEKIVDDHRTEAGQVLANNKRVLNLLTDAIALAEDSTRILDKAFGPSAAQNGGPPRIGRP